VTDDEIRALIAELQPAGSFIAKPPGHVVKGRPDAASAAAAGTDLAALDAWVLAQGGQLRTARGPASGGVRPGRRVAPPPSAPQRYYLLPAKALRGEAT
jgi:hypothetical protein